MSPPSAMKQGGGSYTASSNIATIPVLQQPAECDVKKPQKYGVKESPKEGTTKPPTPTSRSSTGSPVVTTTPPPHIPVHHTGSSGSPSAHTPPVPATSSWDGLNGRDPSSPQAVPKDFVFAQPSALPPRDGPREN